MKKELCIVCNTHNVIKEIYDKDKNIYSYLCLRCGFTSNDYFVNGDSFFENKKKSMSKLVKDLCQTDEQGKTWLPCIIVSSTGMLYPSGTPLDWQWWYVPILPITDEERKEKKYLDKYETQFVVEKKKVFDRFEFLNALKEFGDILIDIEVDK